MRTLAAVDLGAQSGRVAVGRFDGERLTVEEVHRFPNEPVRRGETLFWDVRRLRDEVFAGLQRAGRVDSVAVDSWAVDFGLIDQSGALLHDPVHYRDARRGAAFERVLDVIPARELYERTGIQLLPINTIFELAATTAELDRADQLLLIPDLFNFWLCGSRTTEYTNATTTQCLDVAKRAWAADLLERLNIPARVLPEVVCPGTELGSTDGGAKVIATASHDTGSAVAAVPLESDRCAYLSVGTWSLVGIENDEPILTDEAFDANVTNEGGVDGTFRVLRNVTGLWLLDECRRIWAESGDRYEYDELVALARSAPPFRSLVDPNDASFAEPGDMPARIAEYCSATGQDVPQDVGAFVRCIFESLALKQAETVELLAAVTHREIDTLHVVGGGASNELLCEWTAEASGLPVLAGPVESTLVGNLLVQAIALGELTSLAEGRELVRRSFEPVVYEPSGDRGWAEVST